MSELLDPKEAMVNIYCKQLKLPGLKSTFQELARDAMAQNQTPVAFLAACLLRKWKPELKNGYQPDSDKLSSLRSKR